MRTDLTQRLQALEEKEKEALSKSDPEKVLTSEEADELRMLRKQADEALDVELLGEKFVNRRRELNARHEEIEEYNKLKVALSKFPPP